MTLHLLTHKSKLTPKQPHWTRRKGEDRKYNGCASKDEKEVNFLKKFSFSIMECELAVKSGETRCLGLSPHLFCFSVPVTSQS